MDERVSLNSPPRGKQQVPITQELVQRVAAYISQGGGSAVGLSPNQNDLIPYQDNCDATHPLNIDFPIPSNFQTMLSMRLSLKIRPYRTYSTFSATATGNDTPDHTHAGATHQHSSAAHAHPMAIGAGPSGTNILSLSGGPLNNSAGPFTDNNTIQSTTPGNTGNPTAGNTGGANSQHTHPVTVNSTLGVAESAAPVNPGITVKYDGTDITTAIGGPFNADQVEIDIRPAVGPNPARGVLHVLSLQPNQLSRINGILKLSYQIAPGLS
jgi:hypothetical protein